MRNVKLDLIRFTGVLIIMLAHSGPPGWLFQLRNFGTPLLILGSALTYAYIYKLKTIDRIPFLIKRLTRLTIPLWIFLTFFFLLFWFISLVLKFTFPWSINKMINAYILRGGIGFVWIFKVYIILALITPYSLKLSKSSMSNKKYFTLIILIYLVYEFITHLFLSSSISSSIKLFISQYILVIIPYSMLYLYGLRLHLFTNKNLHVIILFSLLLFTALAIQKYIDFGNFVQTKYYKYPPTLYYLSYAFFAINTIYYIVNRYISITNSRVVNSITWLSSNSLWIYLYHILAFYIWEFSFDSFAGDYIDSFLKFLIKTLFLLIFGIIMTYIQSSIINKILLKDKGSYERILIFLK